MTYGENTAPQLAWWMTFDFHSVTIKPYFASPQHCFIIMLYPRWMRQVQVGPNLRSGSQYLITG